MNNTKILIGAMILISLGLVGIGSADTLNASGQIHEILYQNVDMTVDVGVPRAIDEGFFINITQIVDGSATVGIGKDCAFATFVVDEGLGLGYSVYVDGVRIPTIYLRFVSVNANGSVNLLVTQVSVNYTGMSNNPALLYMLSTYGLGQMPSCNVTVTDGNVTVTDGNVTNGTNVTVGNVTDGNVTNGTNVTNVTAGNVTDGNVTNVTVGNVTDGTNVTNVTVADGTNVTVGNVTDVTPGKDSKTDCEDKIHKKSEQSDNRCDNKSDKNVKKSDNDDKKSDKDDKKSDKDDKKSDKDDKKSDKDDKKSEKSVVMPKKK